MIRSLPPTRPATPLHARPKPSRPATPASAKSPSKPLTEQQRIARGKEIFHVSVDQGKREAAAMVDFFKRHPSHGSNMLISFQTYWAQFHLYEQNSLRAWLYHHSLPCTMDGAPKNALWQAYADACERKLPASVIEERFLRAHMSDFRAATKTPEFRELYALADPTYQRVVSSYLEALDQFEADLDAGKDPQQITRWMTRDTFPYMIKNDAMGAAFEFTVDGIKNMLDLSQPLTRASWEANAAIFKGMLLNRFE